MTARTGRNITGPSCYSISFYFPLVVTYSLNFASPPFASAATITDRFIWHDIYQAMQEKHID